MPVYTVKVTERLTNVWTKKIEAKSLKEAQSIAEDLDVSFDEDDSDWELNQYHQDIYECDFFVTE
jgi:hypothetical protein